MGWPLSRSTRAAASSALNFLSLAAVTDGAAWDSAGGLAPCLAGGRLLAAGVDAGVARFFLAVMEHLLGRRVRSSDVAPFAPPLEVRRTTSTVAPAPGNSRQNPQVLGRRDRTRPAIHSRAGLGRSPQLAPAPALLIPIEYGGNRQEVAERQRLAAMRRPRQEQQLFLQIGRELQKAQDLADAGPADMAQPGHVGVAGDCAGPDQRFDVQRQSHPSRDTRHARRRLGYARRWSLAGSFRARGATTSAPGKGALNDV